MQIKSIIFIIFISSSTFAHNYDQFYSHCILNKNGNFPYTIDQVDSMMDEMYTPTGSYDNFSHQAISSIIRGTTRAYDEVRNIVSVIRRSRFIEGRTIRNWTIKTIQEQIIKHRLNGFERACLVNCATFMLVDYSPSTSTKLGSIYDIYSQGRGICTEMTDISLDLASFANLSGRSVVSSMHNWPEYHIDGKWYILDPTASGCHFLER